MKLTFIILCTLTLIVLACFFYLGYQSHSGSPRGLRNAQLSPCPDKPNCICSEYPNDESHFIVPLSYNEKDTETIVQIIQTIIEGTGGKIVSDNINNRTTYISATYTSTFFRFVDDFEVRVDQQNNLIHIRSASRAGHSDMGVNLKRIQVFTKELAQQISPGKGTDEKT